MTDIRCGLVLVMAALMAGCATPPATRFYTLLPPANATAMPRTIFNRRTAQPPDPRREDRRQESIKAERPLRRG